MNRSGHPLLSCSAIAASTALGCSAAPPPAPAVQVAPAEAPPAAPPARWLRAGGATLPGVPWGDERVLLMGGRRAVLGKDGAIRVEQAPLPELAQDLFLVPTEAGPRLVVVGAHAVFRLDDPLGPAVTLARVDPRKSLYAGPGPGGVAVLGPGAPLHLVDVATGATRAFPGVAQPALISTVFFRSVREGAVVVGGRRVLVTSDGGATFRAIAWAPPGPRHWVSERGGRLFLSSWDERFGVELDPFASPPVAANPAERGPFETWAAWAGDPLWAAVRGAALPGGGWIVARAYDGFARLDADGFVRATVAFPAFDPQWNRGSCEIGEPPGVVLIACEIGEATRVWQLPRGELPAILGPPEREVHRARASASPSGGFRVGDEVRQPDGTWQVIEHADGALADGGAVELVIPPATGPGSDPHRFTTYVQLWIRHADGRKEPQLPVRVPPRPPSRFSNDHLALVGAVEEDEAHHISFVMADATEAFAVNQQPGQEPSVHSFTWARIHAGRGIAASGAGLFASTDAGATWTKVPAPEGLIELTVLEAKQAGMGSGYRHGTDVDVNEAGARIGVQWVRLGWGAPEPVVPAPPLAGPVVDPPAPRERVLSCATVRGAQPAPAKPPGKPAAAGPAPAKRGALPALPRTGHGRHVELDLPKDASAPMVIAFDAPDTSAASPATVTLRWSEDEAATRVHTVTGPAPEGIGWDARSPQVLVRGPEALVELRIGLRTVLVHGGRDGSIATAEPAGGQALAVTLGATPDDPVSWVEEVSTGQVVVIWSPPRAPRRLAYLPVSHTGPASHGGLPVIYEASFTKLFRVLGYPLKGDPPPPSPSDPVPFDGWTDLGSQENLVRLAPPCGPKPPLASQRLATYLRLRVDGVDEPDSRARFDLRYGLSGACIAGIEWKAVPQPAGYYRTARVDVDFTSGHATRKPAAPTPTDSDPTPVACKLDPGS